MSRDDLRNVEDVTDGFEGSKYDNKAAEPIDVKAIIADLRATHAWHADSYSGAWPHHLLAMERAADALEAIEKEREALESILRTAQQLSYERTVTIEEADAPLLFVVKVQGFRRDR